MERQKKAKREFGEKKAILTNIPKSKEIEYNSDDDEEPYDPEISPDVR